MDQVWMWFAVDELREGFFRMPRYWGQAYGSMLEAWLAVPFVGVPYERLLPTVAYVLMVIPYLFLALSAAKSQRWNTGFVVAGFLVLMPIQYVMIGAMPRDMCTGLAITSIALFFVHGQRTRDFVLVGFFCLLGWSFNNNAALLGAVLTLYMFFRPSEMSWQKKLGLLVAGYAAGGLIHGAVELFYYWNPELGLHKQRRFWANTNLFVDAMRNLDRHWGKLAPVLHGAGWLYLVLFAGIIAAGARLKRKEIWLPMTALTVFCIAALSVGKIHDATTSVFFSHERMFMAMPLACLFLALQFPWKIPAMAGRAAAAICVVVAVFQQTAVDAAITRSFAPNTRHLLEVVRVKELYEDCAILEELTERYQAEAVFNGPGHLRYAWTYSHACPAISNVPPMARPEYERKTWQLKALDQPVYQRMLWFTSTLKDSVRHTIPGVSVTPIDAPPPFKHLYLIEGENFNAMRVYKDAGFGVSRYQ